MNRFLIILLTVVSFFSADFIFANPLERIIIQGASDMSVLSEDRIVFHHISIPGNSEELIAQLCPFLGRAISEELVEEMREVIANYYRNEGYPFVVPKIPDQDVTDGALNIHILEGKVGTMTFCGNEWYSKKALSRFIHLREGEMIHQNALLNDLTSLNRNPFHHTQVTARPGEGIGTTDLEFTTHDRHPLRIYAGADNTGVEVTGRERYFLGFNYGNMWGIGDVLTYQWTTAYSAHLFNSHYVSYTSYLPNTHQLDLIGGYATIHPKMTDFTSEGRLIQGSMRYNIPFKPLYGNFTQGITCGCDFKKTNSSLFFVGTTENIPLNTKNVNLTQLVFFYTLQCLKFSSHEISFQLSSYYSPFQWLPNQSSSAYNALRAHAKPQYAYGECMVRDRYSHRFGFIQATLRGQIATGPLLPSEQFGLGGYDTVRGYDERTFDGDNALCLNIEIGAPSFQLFKSNISNPLTFLGFVDYGVAHNYQNALVGIPATTYLLSIGPGLRYTASHHFTARLDYGFQLHKLSFQTNRFGAFHFSVVASY